MPLPLTGGPLIAPRNPFPSPSGPRPPLPQPPRRPTIQPQAPVPTGGSLRPSGPAPTAPAPQATQPGFRQGEGYQNWKTGNRTQRQQFLERQRRMQSAGGINAIRDARTRNTPQWPNIPRDFPPYQTSRPQLQASALESPMTGGQVPGGLPPWLQNMQS